MLKFMLFLTSFMKQGLNLIRSGGGSIGVSIEAVITALAFRVLVSLAFMCL
jgi:hypothetical protein